MDWYHGNPMGWGGAAMMALDLLLFLAGLTALAVVLLRRRPNSPRGGSATRILDERPARDEGGTEEPDRVRRTLDSR
ncbi:hypothetical protein SAMN05216188_10753 [Lentzea xinjiangensis]|uniref:Uncharacterized protein n=1 Tax=Lentzea xinjiangensis TaxID=402600 RepID=A0A1H9KNL8_9PSEU|nr:SHOCT domain-containing protein [Lentzea xinjiangensis]SER00751.1 hypothetical protein SAMN05216188_10753 [Lentzea xinjiangensis]